MAGQKPAAVKLPKALGAKVDLFFELQEQRLALERQADKIHEQERFVRDHLIEAIPKLELDGARGRIGQVALKHVTMPSLADSERFYQHVQKTGEFDLLQKRLNEGACRERWEQNKVIPGVQQLGVIKLSVSRLAAPAKKRGSKK